MMNTNMTINMDINTTIKYQAKSKSDEDDEKSTPLIKWHPVAKGVSEK